MPTYLRNRTGLRCWAGRFRTDLMTRLKWKALPIIIGAWVAVLVLVGKLASESMARLFTPYYPILIAGVLILIALDGRIIRFFIVRLFAGIAMGISLLLIVISPARPLFPTDWAVSAAARLAPSFSGRVERVYSVYGSRYDAMKELRILLPANEKFVGCIQTGDNMEAQLWRPYGSRQIIDVFPDQTLDQLKSEHIHLIVANDYAIKYKYRTTIDELTKKWSATVVATRELTLRATAGPGTWYIIALP